MHPQSNPDKPVPLPDEQLLQEYRKGRKEAFEALIARYRAELFHFLVRFTGDRAAAEDIFQEAFLQVHLSANTFDPQRRFKPWLFTIAANKARDFMRKRVRRPAAQLDAPLGSHSDEGQSFVDLLEANLEMPDEEMQLAELRQKVRHIMVEMPDHLREILLLAYFQRFPYSQIAQILQIPLGTVKSRLHTAVGTFAKNWKQVNRTDNPT